jgi:hypothetical protein
MTCIINNAYCTPKPCVNCGRVFCAHEHPERRAFGYYGQYCTVECHDAKQQTIFAIGENQFSLSRVVLVVEQEYCYLVLNKSHRYGFRILQTNKQSGLDYSHYPGFGTKDCPCTYAMLPDLSIAICVYDESNSSCWTMVGFRFTEKKIDTFGVGGHIEVVDLRKAPHLKQLSFEDCEVSA